MRERKPPKRYAALEICVMIFCGVVAGFAAGSSVEAISTDEMKSSEGFGYPAAVVFSAALTGLAVSVANFFLFIVYWKPGKSCAEMINAYLISSTIIGLIASIGFCEWQWSSTHVNGHVRPAWSP